MAACGAQPYVCCMSTAWGWVEPSLLPPFAAGELLRITHIARGLEAGRELLLDVVVNGFVPESIARAAVLLQVGIGSWWGLAAPLLLCSGAGSLEWGIPQVLFVVPAHGTHLPGRACHSLSGFSP